MQKISSQNFPKALSENPNPPKLTWHWQTLVAPISNVQNILFVLSLFMLRSHAFELVEIVYESNVNEIWHREVLSSLPQFEEQLIRSLQRAETHPAMKNAFTQIQIMNAQVTVEIAGGKWTNFNKPAYPFSRLSLFTNLKIRIPGIAQPFEKKLRVVYRVYSYSGRLGYGITQKDIVETLRRDEKPWLKFCRSLLISLSNNPLFSPNRVQRY